MRIITIDNFVMELYKVGSHERQRHFIILFHNIPQIKRLYVELYFHLPKVITLSIKDKKSNLQETRFNIHFIGSSRKNVREKEKIKNK